jgi:hypothetical protein
MVEHLNSLLARTRLQDVGAANADNDCGASCAYLRRQVGAARGWPASGTGPTRGGERIRDDDGRR